MLSDIKTEVTWGGSEQRGKEVGSGDLVLIGCWLNMCVHL